MDPSAPPQRRVRQQVLHRLGAVAGRADRGDSAYSQADTPISTAREPAGTAASVVTASLEDLLQ